MEVSMSEPAALSAAARPPTAKAKAPPIIISLSTSQVMSISPSGSTTPLETTGESPMASATATIPRTRSGISLEPNSGARMKSGPTRASTRMNAATCCSPKREMSSPAVIRRGWGSATRGRSYRTAAG